MGAGGWPTVRLGAPQPFGSQKGAGAPLLGEQSMHARVWQVSCRLLFPQMSHDVELNSISIFYLEADELNADALGSFLTNDTRTYVQRGAKFHDFKLQRNFPAYLYLYRVR
jgi:hypothetical protein